MSIKEELGAQSVTGISMAAWNATVWYMYAKLEHDRLQIELWAAEWEQMRVSGRNGSGQNGMDRMVWTKWNRQNWMNKLVRQKMVWRKLYGYNGMVKMV